jgi:hypothetical protein
MSDPVPTAKTDEMQRAIGLWMLELNKVAGWQEWRLASMGHQLDYDDDLPAVSIDSISDEFIFPPEIERQHAVIMGFLHMRQTVNALKEVEYYFRRFPFRGLPVTHDGHFTNVCEMYFARFYEFEERMKRYFAALKVVVALDGRAVGNVIKQYSKEFGGHGPRVLMGAGPGERRWGEAIFPHPRSWRSGVR